MTDLYERAKQALDGATPGPWKPFYDEVTGVIADDGRVANCTQITLMGRRHPTEAPANARLIALAPELARAYIAQHEAQDALVKAVERLGLRELVAGWNGENREKPYTPHPDNLGAKISTTCGTVYAIDAALAALQEGEG